MAAPLFYLIAVGLGAATIGATATDAKKWMGTDKNSASLQTFYNTRFTGPADCLTAAVSANAPIEACAIEEPAADGATPAPDGKAASAQAFNPSDFTSETDCLNAAVSERVPLQVCAPER